jgi:hypothetical protein
MILAAGCSSLSIIPEKLSANATKPAITIPTIVPLTATAVPTPLLYVNESNSSIPVHEKPFIQIDPVPHYYFGDIITIQGTTNLLAGEKIKLQILEAFVHCSKGLPRNDSVNGCHGDGIPAIVPVAAGDAGINTWSWYVNSSQHDFGPNGVYTIIVRYTRNESIDNETNFRLYGIPYPNITLNIPENDPNEYAIRFSGQVNTGNGIGEKLSLKILSDSGKEVTNTIPVYRNGTGYFWNFTLKKSAIVPYNFYTVNLTSQINPKIGIVRTFTYNNEPPYYPYNSYSS